MCVYIYFFIFFFNTTPPPMTIACQVYMFPLGSKVLKKNQVRYGVYFTCHGKLAHLLKTC